MLTIDLVVNNILIPSVLGGIFVGSSIFLIAYGIHICLKLFKF